MKTPKMFFIAMVCFSLLILPSVQSVSQAACLTPAKIVGYTYSPISIQEAYDYASGSLALNDFTLLLSSDVSSEDLYLDGGNVVLDGGYDCSFGLRTSTATGIFGTLTVSTGRLTITGNIAIVSTDQCELDPDGDGYFCGSCATVPVDCECNDPNINPGALEICDGIDNNCNGQIDEGIPLIDSDLDGYYAIGSCGDPAYSDDCDDSNPEINPGAPEIPFDGIDQNCDGSDMTFAAENACTFCHAPDTSWYLIHASVAIPDASCAICHSSEVSNILPGHYGQTVQTAGNNMNAGAVINCTSCHDLDVSHPGGVLGNGSGFVWSKVLADLPNVTCDTCHENRAAAHMTATAHDNRIIDANCGLCHSSDTSTPGSPGTGTLTSAADVDALHRSDCSLCHNYTGTTLNAALIRQVIEQGLNGSQVTCLGCHDVYNPPPPQQHSVEVGPNDLSYDPPGQLCNVCHLAANWNEIELLHDVPSNGSGPCATCHSSVRQDVIDTIAIAANPTHCTACHSDKYLTVHGVPVHPSPINVCLPCHNPGPVPEGEFMAIHNNNCGLCHTTIPDLQPGLPFAAVDCNTCHVSNWEALHTTNTPDHSSLVRFSSASCFPCHIVPPPLVNGSPPNSHNGCSSCHDQDGARISGAIGKDFTTGGDCLTCHIAYGLNPWTPDHSSLVQVSTTMCGGCHDDTLIGPEANNHNGCSSCHMPTGALISLAIGKDFISGGDCQTCHVAPWDLHPHAHTVAEGPGDLAYEAPGQLCSTCHMVSTWLEIDNEHNVATNGPSSCDTCHNSPRQEVIDAISLGADPTNCVDCHSNWYLRTPIAVDHVALGYVTSGASPCLNCHDTGAALNGTVTTTHMDNCSLCHTTAPALLPGIPVGGGDCATCHNNSWETLHPGGHDHIVTIPPIPSGCVNCHNIPRLDAPSHAPCAACHDLDGTLRPGVPANLIDCSACHTGSWEPMHYAVTPDHTALVTVTGTTCANCHDNTLVSTSNHLGCSSCHDSNTGELISRAIGKSFVAGGDCSTCHQDYWIDPPMPTPDHSSLVQVANSSCANCHDDTLVGPGAHNVCTSCHAANGSLLSLAIGKDFTTGGDCFTCHTGTWEQTHPIAPDHTPLVTVAGTTCASCHDDTLVSAAWNTHFTCTSCHDANTGDLISLAVGHNFTTGGNCATCHTGSWEATHTPNAPDHTSLVQVGASSCASCHDNTLVGPGAHSACSNCHDANTGVLISRAIGQDFTTGGDCRTCHPDYIIPPPDHSSLVTVVGSSCAGCHSDLPLTDANDPMVHNDCSSCHDANGNLISIAIGQSAPGNCQTCHTSTWETFHTVAPADHSFFVSSCNNCHDSAYVSATTHQACTSCHDPISGDLPGWVIIQIVGPDISCATCHTDTWDILHASHGHTVSLGSGDLYQGMSCGSCHVVQNWTEIESIEHNVATNGAGSCATCHNSSRQEVIDAIALGANPTNCLNCHPIKWELH